MDAEEWDIFLRSCWRDGVTRTFLRYAHGAEVIQFTDDGDMDTIPIAKPPEVKP